MMGWWGNMMGYGVGPGGFLFAGMFGWLCAIVWMINSILIMLVLIKIYERLSNERPSRKK